MREKIKNLFEQKGYVLGDHIKDFGYVIPSCLYYFHPEKHCYVSVMFYGDQFVEAAFEWYRAPKNTRKPKVNPNDKKAEERLMQQGFVPYRLALVRSEKEFEELL